MSDFDVLVVGELNPDVILHGADLTPEFGQTEKLVEAGTLTVGSSGAIFACGAARLGLRVAYMGLVGDDASGRFMLDALTRRGVDVTACRTVPDRPTGLTVALSTGTDRAILTFPGVMADLAADMVPDSLLARTDRLHVSSPHLQPSLRADLPGLFSRAHSAGALTSLDPGWDPDGTWSLEAVLAETDLFLPNENEALRATGTLTAEEALRQLAATVPEVAVKLGSRGAIASMGSETFTALPPEVRSLDATGAGDSFAAGLICGQVEGLSPGRSLALAVACGSLSTRALGGIDAQPELSEALALADPSNERTTE